MKNLLIFVLPALLFSGCYDKADQYRWATVDVRQLEQAAILMASDQNPYPEEIARDKAELRLDKRKISNQIGKLTNIAKKKCENKTKELSEKIGSKEILIAPRFYGHDQECIAKIDSDQLILDLKRQRDELQKWESLQSKHDKKVREMAIDYVEGLIRTYSAGKFELVIRKDNNNVVYNHSGIAIDVTDAVAANISAEELVLAVE